MSATTKTRPTAAPLPGSARAGGTLDDGLPPLSADIVIRRVGRPRREPDQQAKFVAKDSEFAQNGKHFLGGGLVLWTRGPRSRVFYHKYASDRWMALGSPFDGMTEDRAREQIELNKGLLARTPPVDPRSYRAQQQSAVEQQAAEEQRISKLDPSCDAMFRRLCDRKRGKNWRVYEPIDPATGAVRARPGCPTEEFNRRAYRRRVWQAFGKRDVRTITQSDVIALLEPNWMTKYKSMRDTRQLLEWIFEQAEIDGLLRENPAKYQGFMKAHLPFLSRSAQLQDAQIRTNPYRGVHYDHAPLLMRLLERHDSREAMILQVSLLTAVRPDEVEELPKAEIDWANRVWKLQGNRRKGRTKQSLAIPLSQTTLRILRTANDLFPNSPWVFPSIYNPGAMIIHPGTSQRVPDPDNVGKPISHPYVLQCWYEVIEHEQTKDVGKRALIHEHGNRKTIRSWISSGKHGVDFGPINNDDIAIVVLGQAFLGVKAIYDMEYFIDERSLLMDAWDAWLAGPPKMSHAEFRAEYRAGGMVYMPQKLIDKAMAD